MASPSVQFGFRIEKETLQDIRAHAANLNDVSPERVRDEFRDIAASGTFQQGEALPEEANDTAAASLPRLRFRFDRRSLGRLRMLIDLINREG